MTKAFNEYARKVGLLKEKDRNLEGSDFREGLARVIEGAVIAAKAVGATEGFFYIRAEYPLAVKRIRQALINCREHISTGRKYYG